MRKPRPIVASRRSRRAIERSAGAVTEQTLSRVIRSASMPTNRRPRPAKERRRGIFISCYSSAGRGVQQSGLPTVYERETPSGISHYTAYVLARMTRDTTKRLQEELRVGALAALGHLGRLVGFAAFFWLNAHRSRGLRGGLPRRYSWSGRRGRLNRFSGKWLLCEWFLCEWFLCEWLLAHGGLYRGRR